LAGKRLLTKSGRDQLLNQAHAKPAESAGMTTNPPVDLSRINLMEPDEVQYWADKFGVSKERLSEAVAKVGHSVDAVRQELPGS
jgi:hypothetical protein